MSLTTAQAASFTRFQGYEATPGGAIEDLQVFEVSPSDIKGRVFSFQADGKTFELSDVRLTRTSDKYQVEFVATLQLTTQTGPAPAPVTHGRFTKISPNPTQSVSLTISKYFDYGATIAPDPCQQPGGCNSSGHILKEWRRPGTPAEQAKGFDHYYFAQSLRLKSVDYDWATGEWTRLVFTETLFTQMTPKNIPNGGMTVGN